MRLLLIVFSLILIISSCKKDEVGTNKICFIRTTTGLEIENNTNVTFYFAAFSQSSLALIYWYPQCGNNNVSPGSLTSIPMAGLNDQLVVYYWECTGNDPGEIKNVILDNNQSACR